MSHPGQTGGGGGKSCDAGAPPCACEVNNNILMIMIIPYVGLSIIILT